MATPFEYFEHHKLASYSSFRADEEIQETISTMINLVDDVECNEQNLHRICLQLSEISEFAGGDTFESRNSRNIECILKHRGLEVIVAAMTQFSQNSLLQAFALRAIWKFARNHENRRYIAELSADKISSAMRIHFDSWDVQKFACSALLNLSSDLKISKYLANLVLEDLFLVIRAHTDQPRLLEIALAVLRNLARDGSIAHMIMNGSFTDILARMRGFSSQRKLQIICLGLILNLSHHDDNDRVVVLKSLGTIISCMERHLESVDVQTEALNCLLWLSFKVENKRAISISSIDLILRCMQLHITVSEIQRYGCALLGNLLESSEYDCDIQCKDTQYRFPCIFSGCVRYCP